MKGLVIRIGLLAGIIDDAARLCRPVREGARVSSATFFESISAESGIYYLSAIVACFD
jgi:hypothetical protein